MATDNPTMSLARMVAAIYWLTDAGSNVAGGAGSGGPAGAAAATKARDKTQRNGRDALFIGRKIPVPARSNKPHWRDSAPRVRDRIFPIGRVVHRLLDHFCHFSRFSFFWLYLVVLSAIEHNRVQLAALALQSAKCIMISASLSFVFMLL